MPSGEAGRDSRFKVWQDYKTIPWPFEELAPPAPFEFCQMWEYKNYQGYIDSLSATQRFVYEQGFHPLKTVEGRLKSAWGDLSRKRLVTWKLILRVGRKK